LSWGVSADRTPSGGEADGKPSCNTGAPRVGLQLSPQPYFFFLPAGFFLATLTDDFDAEDLVTFLLTGKCPRYFLE
jgi:hypothetical protein